MTDPVRRSSRKAVRSYDPKDWPYPREEDAEREWRESEVDMKDYGKELILDIHDCDPSVFTRESIAKFLEELCDRIDMVREDLHFWDDEDTPEDQKPTEPHLIGISVCQFIRTSNVVMHTLTVMKRLYINIFSCKSFYEKEAEEFTLKWSKGILVRRTCIPRK